MTFFTGDFPAVTSIFSKDRPGTGKTTLALQFLLEGIKNGEKVLYVTLSESRNELEEGIRAHGWSTDSLLLCEMIPPEEDLKPEQQYTVFHPSEVELADTVSAIFRHIDTVKPQRLVLDSLSELRMLARDPLKYRRQILAFKRHLAGQNCTVLLSTTAPLTTATTFSFRASLTASFRWRASTATTESSAVAFKFASSAAQTFAAAFTTTPSRPTESPSIRAWSPPNISPALNVTMLPSGIQELDDLLRGGIDSGTSTLLLGPQAAANPPLRSAMPCPPPSAAKKLCSSPSMRRHPTLLDRAEGLGMSPRPLIEKNLLEIQQIDPAELSPGEFVARIRRLVDQENLRVLVIDSMNGLLNAMPHEQFLAMQLHELFSYLGQQGIATIITLAQHGVIGTSMNSPVDVSYLADTVLLFRYFEGSGRIHHAISVVKKRSGSHERTIRELVFGDGKLYVGKPLTDFEGILTGVPKFVGSAPRTERTPVLGE